VARTSVIVVAAAAAALAAASVAGVATVDGDTAAPAPPTTTTLRGRPLAPDQVEIRGVASKVTGTEVAGPVLALPLTLTVVRGGGTKATFGGGTVGGKVANVVWDGGRPLPLSGTGGIDLAGPADVDVTAAGTGWHLDGAPRGLQPGTYRMGATVAVGRSGLGEPRDGVEYAVVTPGSVTTGGGVTITVPPGAVTLRGPGSLVIEGDLTVRTSAGARPAATVRFGPGPFELSLSPRPDGRLDVTSSLLQGAVS
jgi:hypothetical protein